MLRFAWLKVTILSCFLTLSGCLGGDDENVSCFMIGDAEGTIFVSVGCGNPKTQPLYLWDGGAVAAIEVRNSDDVLIWRVFGLLENIIEQPVQHGVPPPGTLEVGVETELDYEVEYIVKVERFGSGLTAGGSGTLEFTILPEEESLP